jgi:hypothetical protein
MFRVTRITIGCGKIAVALRARLILCRHKIYVPAMFHMTLRARQLQIYVRCMMYRSVMTAQTRGIRRGRGKSPSLLHVARGALLFQNRMSPAQGAARINAVVMPQKMPSNPHQRDRWRNNRQPQLRSLERSRSLEIVQVNPLSDCFSCARSRHDDPLAVNRVPCSFFAVSVAIRSLSFDFQLSTADFPSPT